MKQGKASSNSSSGMKSEPNPRAMNIEHIAGMGIHKVYTKVPPSGHEGRGYKAPIAGEECHPCGSQGKY
jgi:hypothetical protein